MRVFFADGLWMHARGGVVVPDGPVFDMSPHSVKRWSDEPDVYVRNVRTYWYKLYTPRPGDVIVDVGAGRGEDELAFSRDVGTNGRVVAVEAHPGSFRLLQQFCTHNGLSNVLPVHAAASDHRGRTFIADDPGGAWEAAALTSSDAGFEVEALPVDDVCAAAHVDRVAFLKVNIEGAEREALAAMTSTLARTDVVCICAHDFRANRGHGERFRTRDFVVAFLREHGFEVIPFPHRYDFEDDHVHARRLH